MRALGLVFLVLCGCNASASVVAKWGMYAGFRIDYKVVLPNGYNPARAYPTLMVLPDGPEDIGAVDAALDPWRAEAERRGYIVISPAVPEHQPFSEGGDIIFPEFLDQMLHNYKVIGRKFHLAGALDGGVAAFRLAAQFPRYFYSVTGVPGYLDDPPSTLRGLRQVCVFMDVGEGDTVWFDDIQKQADTFRESGLTVNLQVEPDQGRVLHFDAAGIKRLFDQFAQAQQGCGR